MLTAVVLAAGAGTRLGAAGRRWSKAMVPVAGRPLIEWVIERLRHVRIERLIVVRNAGDEALATWLGAQRADVAGTVQPERLGIADAVRCALPLLGGDPSPYLACACDSLFDARDLSAVLDAGRMHAGAAVVGVLNMGVEATVSRSAVCIDGDRIVEIVEKPDPASASSGLVGAPLYWLPRTVDPLLAATRVRGGERHVSSALNDFIARGGEVRAVRLGGRIEVTTAADIVAAERALLGRPPP